MSGTSAGLLARLRQPVSLQRSPHNLVGGTPQVSLLPPEVREAGAVAAHRRKLVAVVVVAALVAVAAVAAAQNAAGGAQARLAGVNRQASVLAAQTARFRDVRSLESVIAAGRAGVDVGSSTLIDWQQQIDLIEAAMPSGYSVTALSANGATPFMAYPQGDNLLEPRRAATVTLTVAAPTMGHPFSVWLRKLRSIPAYADATASTVRDAGTGANTITLIVHLTPKVLSPGTWTEQR